jgi:hypothetical protein
LTVRDLIFLYCFSIYDQANQDVLASLPAERSELLNGELKKFERFPKEVRLNVVLKLLGYLIQHVRNPHIEMIHPSWIADSLKKEDYQTKITILNKFSPEYRSQVAGLLKLTPPSGLRNEMTSTESNDVIFQIFSNRFASMAPPWGESELSADTIYLFKSEDLMFVMMQLGIREIARAFTLAGKDILAALVSRFPKELQEDFLKGIRLASGETPEKQKIATKRLSKYDLASVPLEDVTLKLGIVKVGAMLQNKSSIKRKIAQRIPSEYGILLLQATGEESEMDGGEEMMGIVHRLINKKKIAFAAQESPAKAAGDISERDLLTE